MKYNEGQAVLYSCGPFKNILAYIRRVNNRPEVAESQRNYQVEVNGYLVTVFLEQEDQYLAPAPPKTRPPIKKPGIFGGLKMPGWFGGKEEIDVQPGK